MPEIYKQVVIIGIAGVMTVLRGVGTPPPARPGAAIVSVTPGGQVNALTIYITATLTPVASAPAQASPAASTTPQAQPQRSFAVADASETPTAAPPKPTPTKPKVAAPIKKPVAPPAPASVSCGNINGQSYGAMNVRGGPTDRVAGSQADLNLGLRGWAQVNAPLGLINLGGPTDDRSPRFQGLFGPSRMPRITAAYQVYNWDFGASRRSSPVGDPSVTLLGFATAPGEIIHVPNAAYDIGNGYAALVLYAEPSRITLKYTREDNVAVGYTLHIESICVEPRLLALYRALNAGGRRQLPALRNGQPLGIATGGQIIAGIQESGTWMDPRSRKDWW